MVSSTPVTQVPSQGITPPSESRNTMFNPTVARPLFGFSMAMNNKDYPYGMPTSMMVGLHTNMSTFSDNAMATVSSYNPQNAFASTINNMVRSGGICYIPYTSPSLNTTSMMDMRQQMDESNLELVNSLAQQMEIIFNPLITNTNQTYELLANQMGRITGFFGTLQIPPRLTPQISNVEQVETPKNGMVHANVSQDQRFRPELVPNREEEEYIGQHNPRPLMLQRNQDTDQVL